MISGDKGRGTYPFGSIALYCICEWISHASAPALNEEWSSSSNTRLYILHGDTATIRE